MSAYSDDLLAIAELQLEKLDAHLAIAEHWADRLIELVGAGR